MLTSPSVISSNISVAAAGSSNEILQNNKFFEQNHDYLEPLQTSVVGKEGLSCRKEKTSIITKRTSKRQHYDCRSSLLDNKAVGTPGARPRKSKKISATLLPVLESLADFTPNVFEKTKEEEDMIRAELERNLIFKVVFKEKGDSAAAAKDLMIKAFEPVVNFNRGDVIIHQGDIGDYCYILGGQGSSVVYEDDGTHVGESSLPGTSFGEIALMYDCPRKVTVRATSDNMLLYRVDQFTFRHILMIRSSMSRDEEAKRSLEEESGGTKVTCRFNKKDEYGSPIVVRQPQLNYHEDKDVQRNGDVLGGSGDSDDSYYLTYMKEFSQSRMLVRRFLTHPDVSLDCFKLKKLLGEGQYGKVWLVKPKQKEIEKEEFALKIQSQEELTRNSSGSKSYAKTKQLIERECSIMKKLCGHPFIVEFVHTFEDNGANIYIAMGVIKGKELWDCIYWEQDDGQWIFGMSEDDAKFYSILIADTLHFVHRRQICHRDIKPENIMINQHSGYPTLVDFGLAKFLPDDVTYTLCGTPKYVSPEICQNGGHGCATDFWSLGVMVYEMLSGESPFWYEGIDDTQLMDDICNADPYEIGVEISEEAKDIVVGLLEKDPKYRLVGQNVTSHPWFDDIDLDKARRMELPAPVLF